MDSFHHTYHEDRTGKPSPYSAEDMAISEALVRYHEIYGVEYESLTLRPKTCPQRGYDLVKGGHYCDLIEVEIVPRADRQGD